MYENDGDSAGIVRLKKVESRFFHHIGATQGTHHSEQEQVVRRPEVGDRRRKICCQRPDLSLYWCKRVTARSSQVQDSIRSVKIKRGGNGCSHSLTRRKVFWRGHRPDADESATDTV